MDAVPGHLCQEGDGALLLLVPDDRAEPARLLGRFVDGLEQPIRF